MGTGTSLAGGSYYYRIGEFALLSGVSVKTLRFYDEIGLLRPAGVDARTRYRLYVPSQLGTLALIVSLKDLGVSLAEIRQVIQKRNPIAERRGALESVRADLRRSIRFAKRSLEWIDAEMSDSGGSTASFSVVTKRRPSLRVASIRSVLKNYEEVVLLEQELRESLPRDSIGKTSGVLWHRCADSGRLEAEPFIELRRDVPRRDHYDVRNLAPATLACAYSPLENDAEPAYEAIRRWMSIRRLRLAGAKRELYLGELLEIQFPVVAA